MSVDPSARALDSLPGAHPYPPSSRHHDAEIGTHVRPDGTEVRYTKRRLLPPLATDTDTDRGTDADGGATEAHTVGAGERLDHLGQRYFGAADQWWRIADANPALDPRELTAEPGREIEIPVPGAFPHTPGSGRA
ncbi:hypothetical protein SAMN06297387_110180 [Streptomyces zhaozhouensis]|uniref:LysM domain-containing protein n=1 Tax=Streptomyces zhaozhouensis TaxID=1300267 RepID=A0A286DXQ4_9ACTN|nr:hypothetical protein [Streptomyces zhaozhouensis]SOD63448.1 hypothetical protein SAMN06297387_110180 [Streptomyces zhaozhouensis]